MADLFRGYDLTTMVDQVAEKQYQRMLDEGVRQGIPAERMATYESLSAVDKRNYKEQFLPVVTDILEAMESVKAPDRPLVDRRDMKWLVNEIEVTREEVFTLLASGEAGLTDRAVLYLAEQEDD